MPQCQFGEFLVSFVVQWQKQINIKGGIGINRASLYIDLHAKHIFIYLLLCWQSELAGRKRKRSSFNICLIERIHQDEQ